MVKPNLVIINSEQFGHHIDTYYYCRYLRDDFNLTYICWDQGLPKVAPANVDVIYVPRNGGVRRVTRFLSAVNQALNALGSQAPTVIFNNYMKVMSSILKIQHWRYKFVLDIRTCDVSPNRWVRTGKDLLLRAECFLFRHVSVISESLAGKLGLSGRAYILPLGADEIAPGDRCFDVPRVLYVGTLSNRNIDTALCGFADYLKSSGSDAQLTIVGGSQGGEEAELRALAGKLDLSDCIHVVGRVPHDQLTPYFEAHNVGLSYIPMTPYYDVQPPTKTFEYLLSGMVVLATATAENTKVISPDNGVLVDDTAAGICQGLQRLENKFQRLDSDLIRNSAARYRWSEIIVNLRHYLSDVIDAKHGAGASSE